MGRLWIIPAAMSACSLALAGWTVIAGHGLFAALPLFSAACFFEAARIEWQAASRRALAQEQG